jgi:hypothetical protein
MPYKLCLMPTLTWLPALCLRWHDYLPYVYTDMITCLMSTLTWLLALCLRWHDYLPYAHADMITCLMSTLTWLPTLCLRWHDYLPYVYADMITCFMPTLTWLPALCLRWHDYLPYVYADMITCLMPTLTWLPAWCNCTVWWKTVARWGACTRRDSGPQWVPACCTRTHTSWWPGRAWQRWRRGRRMTVRADGSWSPATNTNQKWWWCSSFVSRRRPLCHQSICECAGGWSDQCTYM